MVTIRVQSAVWLAVVLMALVVVGCELGSGVQPAATPHPPATPMPPLPPTEARDHNEKIIDGYLRVQYIPCEPTGAAYVAPIILTDLRSGSYILLNRNGTVMSSRKPSYKSEEGKAALEAALRDRKVVEQIVARPSCGGQQADDPRIRQQGGWPDAYAEDIGEPVIPRVAISTVPASTLGAAIYPGWRGSYCWAMDGDEQVCEEVEDWVGFAEAKALRSRPDATFHFTVLGEEASPGGISGIRMFTMREQWSPRERKQAAERGEEVYSVEAPDGQRVDAIQAPDTLVGDYMLIASYESPLGEVEYGFKVSVGTRE